MKNKYYDNYTIIKLNDKISDIDENVSEIEFNDINNIDFDDDIDIGNDDNYMSYILELNNGKYYLVDSNKSIRKGSYETFTNACRWIKNCGGIKCVLKPLYNNIDNIDDNIFIGTMLCMYKYGYDDIRSRTYKKLNKLDEYEKDIIICRLRMYFTDEYLEEIKSRMNIVLDRYNIMNIDILNYQNSIKEIRINIIKETFNNTNYTNIIFKKKVYRNKSKNRFDKIEDNSKISNLLYDTGKSLTDTISVIGVYVLQLTDDRYYIGQSNNLKRRINEHLCCHGSKFVKSCGKNAIINVLKPITREIEDLDEWELSEYLVRVKLHTFDKVRGSYYSKNNYSDEIKNKITTLVDKLFEDGYYNNIDITKSEEPLNTIAENDKITFYKIINKSTNYSYIGYTMYSLEIAFNQHKMLCKRFMCNDLLLYEYVKSIGSWNNFIIEMIDVYDKNEKQLYEIRKKYIEKFNAILNYNCNNIYHKIIDDKIYLYKFDHNTCIFELENYS